jgi:uncharacterized tellurite resistance protein B-like protein
MLEPLRKFIRRRRTVEITAAPAESPHDEIQLAATALLLDLACADGAFTPPERSHIESALSRHFNLDLASVQELLQLADVERRQSPDPSVFTRMLCEHLDVGQRLTLAEVMYSVMVVDGHVADANSALLKKLADLVDVPAGYLSQAKQRASRVQPAL